MFYHDVLTVEWVAANNVDFDLGLGSAKIKYCSIWQSTAVYTMVYRNGIKPYRGHCEIASSSGHLVDMPTSDGL